MSNHFLWDNFFKRKTKKDIYSLLKHIPIFEDLSRRELKAIERILHRRIYLEDEYIFREGEIGLGMYIIEIGEVAIVAGKVKQEIARLTDGEFFGEMALFMEQPRNAGAIAVRETKVFGFFQPDLQGILETNPKLGVSVVMKLTRIISERLHRATIENRKLHDTLSSLASK